MAGKRAVVRGHGVFGKRHAIAPCANSCVIHLTKSITICMLQASKDCFAIDSLKNVVSMVDIVVASAGTRSIIVAKSMVEMKTTPSW